MAKHTLQNGKKSFDLKAALAFRTYIFYMGAITRHRSTVANHNSVPVCILNINHTLGAKVRSQLPRDGRHVETSNAGVPLIKHRFR